MRNKIKRFIILLCDFSAKNALFFLYQIKKKLKLYNSLYFKGGYYA